MNRKIASGGFHRPLRGLGIILPPDRKSTRLNSSHDQISYAVFCLKKKNRRPNPSATFREPWRCQNSLAESIWKTSGSVAGRFMMPSWMPEIGSVVTAYVNGGKLFCTNH